MRQVRPNSSASVPAPGPHHEVQQVDEHLVLALVIAVRQIQSRWPGAQARNQMPACLEAPMRR